MDRKRIAIACQGGGSQCAFVAGALKTLLAEGVQNQFRIVGLSGTSGGAITAALAWFDLLEQARDGQPAVEDRIIACWKDLTAQTPIERMFDRSTIGLLRMTEHGLLPSFASTPSSPLSQFWTRAAAFMIGRPEFTDLRAVLTKHIDFDALPGLVQPESPVLLVGAADILEGSFKIFSSRNKEIKVEALLASAAVPNLFPAVWVDGHAYWDGIFAANPPVAGFLRRPLMGIGKQPEEIWIIQVNRAQHEVIPETPSDIFDRRNHLAGNLSLQHDLEKIEMVNVLLRENALTSGFRELYGLDLTEPITVRFLRMSPDLQKQLDYPSKLSRQPNHINRLIADGELQARAFLANLQAVEQVPPFLGEGAPAQPH